MTKIKAKTRNREFFLCKNAYIRAKTRRYRGHVCWACTKVKRMAGSVVLFSDRCLSHWNPAQERWYIHSNDYIWFCRDCKKGDAPSSLHINPQKWQEIQAYKYSYPETLVQAQRLDKTYEDSSRDQNQSV